MEGDFNSFFDLYVPKNYECDALYIFTPDLMQIFIKHSGSYDAEIVDDKLYIYSDTKFNLTNPIELEEIFNIIDTVGTKTLSRTDKYIDEKVDPRSVDIVGIQGSRLKRSFQWITIIIVVLYLLLLISIDINNKR